jgi:hypothetical protein
MVADVWRCVKFQRRWLAQQLVGALQPHYVSYLVRRVPWLVNLLVLQKESHEMGAWSLVQSLRLRPQPLHEDPLVSFCQRVYGV